MKICSASSLIGNANQNHNEILTLQPLQYSIQKTWGNEKIWGKWEPELVGGKYKTPQENGLMVPQKAWHTELPYDLQSL